MEQVLAIPELREHILSFVRGFRDLQTAYNVCTDWRATMRHIMRARGLQPWPVLSSACDEHGHIVPRLRADFSAWTSNALVIPSCILVFVSCLNHNEAASLHFLEALRDQLGVYRAKLLLCSGQGMFHPGQTLSIRQENDDAYAIALQVIPESEDIGVHPFWTPRDDLLAHDLTPDLLNSIMFGERDTYPDPKAVMFITRNRFEEACTMAAALKTQLPDIALAGGISMISCGNLESCGPHLFGVAFSGPHIKALSLISERGLHDSRELLQALAATEGPRMRVCMATLVCCLGRFREQQEAQETEQKLLERAFPGVQSIGYFSGGEIGFSEDEVLHVHTRPGEYTLLHALHQDTTVFFLVGFERR
ncbi:hypothetical protein PTSG_07570 [Salpingoeca rosetta]|uniref:FIST C-domain domain-containing protein n=1 Tax=Salpingoeca rosetta (strain ATCC 50818 / BSB-021) TaxID=946362 RepID=F2UH52_SALR5|nr:uncharacterized protein PTSG_07570 [Salpingoeca rosetta]EGD76451.1 hypothetical protein PTSG_07570 [Salpingoeca rosetta]|eukprot:XP_004991366.1 hypothetical protein PTSG_07570 [Salpingoeca rosetta]